MVNQTQFIKKIALALRKKKVYILGPATTLAFTKENTFKWNTSRLNGQGHMFLAGI